MRIFLLPLTTRQALVFCQRISQKPPTELSIADRITKKAAETWSKWEQAEKGWQKTVVTYGNRGLQRIPYQEWGLKSFPPSNTTSQGELLAEGKKFDVVYPGNIMKEEDVPKILLRLARERKQLHWNRFMGSMIAMPFTIPFAVVPVVPNIPFFYAAYRCWSHWRALKGSDQLDFILDNRLIQPKSTPEMEGIYSNQALTPENHFDFITKGQVEAGADPEEKQLLLAGAHTLISKTLGVPELSGEVERAVWQITQKLQKDKSQTDDSVATESKAPLSEKPDDKKQ